MTIYQMQAIGPLFALDGKGAIASKKVYTAPPSKAEIEEFKQKCGPEHGGIYDLDPTKIKIRITKLDLIDNSNGDYDECVREG